MIQTTTLTMISFYQLFRSASLLCLTLHFTPSIFAQSSFIDTVGLGSNTMSTGFSESQIFCQDGSTIYVLDRMGNFQKEFSDPSWGYHQNLYGKDSLILTQTSGYFALFDTSGTPISAYNSTIAGLFNDIEFTSDGHFIGVATWGSGDGTLAKFKVNGDTIWMRSLTDPTNIPDARANEVEETTDHGFICNPYRFLLKTNADGQQEWMYNLQAAGESRAIAAYQDSLILSFGTDGLTSSATHHLVALTNGGTQVWNKSYEIQELTFDEILFAEDILVCEDGGLLLVFMNELYNSWDVPTSVFVRTNELGDTLWTRKYQAQMGELAEENKVAETSDGGFIFIANIQDSTSTTGERTAIVKVDSLGRLPDCTGVDLGPVDIIIDSPTLSIPSIQNTISAYAWDLFDSPYNPNVTITTDSLSWWCGDASTSPTSIHENHPANSLTVYPSPNAGVFKINTSSLGNVLVTVVSMDGRQVYSEQHDTAMNEVKLSVSPGIYLLRLASKSGIYEKVVYNSKYKSVSMRKTESMLQFSM